LNFLVNKVSEAKIAAKYIRIKSLQMITNANSSHIGSCLSVADVLAVVHQNVCENGDELVFSKGHAAAALYASLANLNLISEESLIEFGGDGTEMIGHVNHAVNGVRFSTGSLGHGFPIAIGIAAASKQKKVFVIISDGELNEGTTWESLAIANQLQLKNLTVIIDVNGIQSFGSTNEVLNLEPLIDKFQNFGWLCIEVDGHSIESLLKSLEIPSVDKPKIIIARTIKGKGILSMEGKLEWHYKSPTKEEVVDFIAEIENNA
jgi:transketolase